QPIAETRRHGIHQSLHTLRAINDTDYRDDQVIQKHRPARQKTEMRIQAATDIRVSRTSGWIKAGHPSVAQSSKHHSDEGDKNCGAHMPMRVRAGQTEYPDRSHWLNEHDTVEDQIAETKHTPEAGRCLGFADAG